MKTRFFAFAALALTLAACNKHETPNADGTLPAGEYPLIIQACGLDVTATPQAAPATRATVDSDWQGVTSVALRLDGAVKEYTVTASDADGYRSATLSRENDPHYWPNRDDITVSAWWPYAETLPAVKVAEDQSKLADFQNSDFISAENQTVTFDDPKLTFTHRTARVTVALKPGTGIASVAGATVSLVSLSAEGSNPTAITTCNTSGDTYEALTAPQTIKAGNDFIEVRLGNGAFYFRPQSDVVLEAGSRYTYTVKVNATGLTLEGCEIGKWEPGQGESGDTEIDPGFYHDKETNTYTVYSVDGLLAWNEAVQNDLALNCILATDIDMRGFLWTPIGDGSTSAKGYQGTFDGQGHTITELTVNLPDQDDVGLFCCIEAKGTVKGLTLEKVKITSNSYAGGVAGSNYGTITACTVSGYVSAKFWGQGGVAGYNEGTITACCTSVSVSAPASYYLLNAGGVAGYNYGTITACYATGTVSGDFAGGVAGDNSGPLTACYWSNYDGSGVGKGSGDVTKVDGTTVTWEDAQTGMNDAIGTWNAENPDRPCNWQYANASATTPPVLVPMN